MEDPGLGGSNGSGSGSSVGSFIKGLQDKLSKRSSRVASLADMDLTVQALLQECGKCIMSVNIREYCNIMIYSPVYRVMMRVNYIQKPISNLTGIVYVLR